VNIQGSEGQISVRVWPNPTARRLVVIAHGYGEHIARYEHVSAALVARGATVWGPDHLGHGHSAGERVLIRDVEHMVDDLHQVVTMARARANLPVVLIGHSMGGMIATRYAQRHAATLAGLVLSGPAIGGLTLVQQLLATAVIPDTPIDPTVLSRDPAVQRAYADDPLVYHGPFKRPTLEAFRAALAAIDAGPGFGPLPTLWLHGEDDQLVPIAATRAAIAKLRGADFSERVYAGARHEVFNETNRAEVLDEVCAFVDRAAVTGRPRP
jgi:alpha-beta hydrolase superfamily lysophospholipase